MQSAHGQSLAEAAEQHVGSIGTVSFADTDPRPTLGICRQSFVRRHPSEKSPDMPGEQPPDHALLAHAANGQQCTQMSSVWGHQARSNGGRPPTANDTTSAG